MRFGIFSTITTPYNLGESLYWLMKRACGPSKRYAGITESALPDCELNETAVCSCRLVFAGDIMPVGNRFVDTGRGLKEFLRDADYFIVNLEGPVVEPSNDALFLVSDRRHSRQIIDILARIFAPAKTCLALANNHASDFGKDEFYRSAAMLEAYGFGVFGHNERPFFDIGDNLRIISGTMWTNRPSGYVFRLEPEVYNCIKPAVYNILYPHWGYEFELYPRPEMIEMGKKLIQKFDAVIGHHSHCPQPVVIESRQGVSKPLAYSLGDFLSVRRSKKYRYGLVIKVELGQDAKGRWLASRLQWRLTKCCASSNGRFTVDISNDAIFR